MREEEEDIKARGPLGFEGRICHTCNHYHYRGYYTIDKSDRLGIGTICSYCRRPAATASGTGDEVVVVRTVSADEMFI